MATTTLKSRVIKKLEKASDKELNQIFIYLDGIKAREDRKRRVLSFAGSWKNLPDDLFNELTNDLHKKRKSNRDILR